MNPYGGCTHACLYCYAPFICRFTGHAEKWGEFLDVKVNFPAVLEKQLSSRRTQPKGRILLGTVTDAYQPAEARYEITRSSLDILVGYPHLEVHVLTKSNLVQRDIPVLQQLQGCEVGFTITTLDPGISGVLEPGAPAPGLRLEAAGELKKAGIPVWVFIAPLLPGLTDTEEALTTLFQGLRKNGIRNIQVDCLNPYATVVHSLRNAYRSHFPRALAALEEYLLHPASYRRETAGRIHKLISREGNGDEVRAV
jgi:DNA repair photolyase